MRTFSRSSEERRSGGSPHGYSGVRNLHVRSRATEKVVHGVANATPKTSLRRKERRSLARTLWSVRSYDRPYWTSYSKL